MVPTSSAPMPRLLTLPGELRNQIYHHFFEDGDTANLQLLQTCKQVYNEAGLLAFSATTFKITKLGARLNAEHKAAITTISRETQAKSCLRIIRTIYKFSVRPRVVILTSPPQSLRWRGWTYVAGLGAEAWGFGDLLSKLAVPNTSLERIVLQTVFSRETDSSVSYQNGIFADYDIRLAQFQFGTKLWARWNDHVDEAQFRALKRSTCFFEVAEVTMKVIKEDGARSFAVRWETIIL